MIDTVRNGRRRAVKKSLAWGFWALNLATIVYFWSAQGWPGVTSGDTLTALHAIGRLFGLFATFCALTQFVLMGRAGWLEPIFGMDRLAIFHRRNGVATLTLFLLHSSLITITHPLLQNSTNFLGVLELPYVWLAAIAEVLFVLTVGVSIYIVRRRLKFETWYAVHLLNYAAIALVPWHQLTNGGDLLASHTFSYYWISLYAFAALNILIWRFGRTGLLYMRHQFEVDKVVAQTATATSVYIKGQHMDKFHSKAGQFILVRFLARPFVWQEHPFSLSKVTDADGLRLTIRQLGDFTNMVPQLKPGTKVWVSGPFGAFTHELQRTNKLLYIVGGIGITPIYSMIQDQAARGESGNAVMLYGNRTEVDTIFLKELTALGEQIHMPIYNVLSDQKDYKGEKGFIDKEKIARLVPDVATRDVFLCGPPPMMAGIRVMLRELGVPESQIHYERFALHKG